MDTRIWLTLALLATTGIAGCLDGEDPEDGPPSTLTIEQALADGLTSFDERELLPFDVTGVRSVTLVPGSYGIESPRDLYVPIDLPVTEGGNAINPADPPTVHLGYILPTIPGCDWEAASLPEECRVPVIADAGPYYGTPGDTLQPEGDAPANTNQSGRLGGWLIDTFVPHGYAVAQISVFGTGLSNHCFDMFGLAEQLGVVGAVEALGDAPWSNGNVGLIGRSYDGSTPWAAAAHGPEALKTIVPISGLSGLGDLVTWNGASEARAIEFQNVVYGTFGFDSNQLPQDAAAHATCPDWLTATPFGAGAYASGNDVVDAEGTYWEERHFLPGALTNYDGSIYMIHGLQDDNVDPHAGWIAELAMREKGNDVRTMWPQGFHCYPDRLDEGELPGSGGSCRLGPDARIRMDWAQDMLEWFDHYLKGTGPRPALVAQMEELDGPWRQEAVWPPADAIVRDIALGTGTVRTSAVDDDVDLPLGVLSETEDVLMAGFTTITLSVTPSGPGGQVAVELRDGTTDTDFGLSYGILELRQADPEDPAVVPEQEMTVTFGLQLFDARLPAGHELVLRISESTNGFLPGAVASPVTTDLAKSTLHLSTLERGEDAYFTPPVWWVEDADGTIRHKTADDA